MQIQCDECQHQEMVNIPLLIKIIDRGVPKGRLALMAYLQSETHFSDAVMDEIMTG